MAAAVTVGSVMAWIRKTGSAKALLHEVSLVRRAPLDQRHAAALKTATKLSKSDNATERWVGKDALRDITRPLVLAKLARRP